MSEITLIVGLAADGKTTLAETLAKVHGGVPFKSDDCRYVPDTWTRRDAAEFIADVEARLKEEAGKKVLIDTTYNDAHDPQNARRRLVDELIKSGRVGTLIIFKSEEMEHLEGIMTRSFNRLLKTERQGAAKETPKDVAALMRKSVKNYEANVAALEELELMARGKEGVRVIVGKRDQVYERLRASGDLPA
jgi:hypothetical protein